MDATKPYEFIGFGAMDATKPYKFIGFGAMEATKPYESGLTWPGKLEFWDPGCLAQPPASACHCGCCGFGLCPEVLNFLLMRN